MNARRLRPGRLAGAALASLFAAAGAARAQVQWMSESPSLSPPARRDAVLIGDANEGAGATLFGGMSASGAPHGDTWRWDGTAWTRLAPLLSPAPRSESAAEALPDAGIAVLFGGLDAAGRVLDDTWLFDGSQWSSASPRFRPPGRAGHSMTHDPGRNICLVFGGRGASGEALGDTWTYDGSAWQVGDPQIRPAARWGHSAIYDPTVGGIIVIGGKDERGTVYDDMWHYDGANWRRLAEGALRPPARHDASIARHPALGVTVLFGGVDDHGVALGDTWIWSGTEWTGWCSWAARRRAPRRRCARTRGRSLRSAWGRSTRAKVL